MSENDYYKILGIEKSADAKQLKDAYRELAFQYHPDRNKENPDSAEKMKKINEAYAVLSNPEKKQEYDSMRMRFGESAYGKFRNEYSEQDIFSGSDINHIFDEMAKVFGFRGVDEIFSEFYGKGYKTFEFKQPGFFAAGFILSNFFGNIRPKTENAPILNHVDKLSRFLIKKLSGIEIPANGTDISKIIYLSSSQAKEGGPYAYFLKKKSKKLVITIPKGIKEGQRIRLAGMGEMGASGGSPGDLYLKVVLWKSWKKKLKNFTNSLIGR